MGDPRKLRKKFDKPNHPWQKLRIEEERVLLKEYGFKNKLELWKLNSLLKKYKLQVKELIPKRDPKSEEQKKKLLEKMKQYALIKEGAIMEDILALSLKDLCERRLQTIVFRKGLARTIKQARQFITHEHIMVGNKKITSPSYILTAEEEALVRFADNSPLFFDTHPERIPLQQELRKEMHELGLKEEGEKKVEEELQNSSKESKKSTKKDIDNKEKKSKKVKKIEE
ncbi:MAG: 30S ribosomal protein S4 [Candidatus Woesearchaeota archaeon]